MFNGNASILVKRNGLRVARSVALGVLVAAWAAPASAAVYRYVDWTAANVAAGTATGVITMPDNSTVTVGFTAKQPGGAADTLYGAQTDGGGTNYWDLMAPYLSAEVENGPPSTDILQLMGGVGATYTVTLSEPIKDPIMAIVSLGAPSVTTTYDFDSPFTIVSQGVGHWGGSDTALVQLPNDILQGNEGHGTIRFVGTFSTFSWTVPTPEGWHGFTFGIRTTTRIEPEGGAGGAGGSGGADSGGAGGTAGGTDAGGTDAGGTDAGGSAGDNGNGGSAGSGASAGSNEGGTTSTTGGTGSGGTAGHDSGAGSGGEGADLGTGGDGAGAGGVDATGGTGGTRGGTTGAGGRSTSGGTGLGGEGGEGDPGEEAGCNCSVPGRGDTSLPLTSAVMALGAIAFWRRGRRRRG